MRSHMTEETIMIRASKIRQEKKLQQSIWLMHLTWPNLHTATMGKGAKFPSLTKLCQILTIPVTELVTDQHPEMSYILEDLKEVEKKLSR